MKITDEMLDRLAQALYESMGGTSHWNYITQTRKKTYQGYVNSVLEMAGYGEILNALEVAEKYVHYQSTRGAGEKVQLDGSMVQPHVDHGRVIDALKWAREGRYNLDPEAGTRLTATDEAEVTEVRLQDEPHMRTKPVELHIDCLLYTSPSPRDS